MNDPATGAAVQVFFLRRYINMRIRDVRDNPAGLIVELGPQGRMGARRLLFAGVTTITELPDVGRPQGDGDPEWDQLQIDIGDELAERRRYEEDELS